MRRYLIFCFAVGLCLFFGAASHASPKRIASLTPVGTEILFDLGQGPNIIAVTEFCDYPAEALAKPKLGSFAGINFEALIAMKTDLLVLQDMHAQFKPQLDRLKIPYVILKQNSVDEICADIIMLGEICGVEEKAADRVASIRADLAGIASKTANATRPKVMLCVSRELSESKINSFYVAAANNFYNELISLAGGENVSKETRAAYPHISVEGLLKLNPDVIIDLVGDRNYYHSKERIDVDVIFSKEYLARQWKNSAAVNAVKKGNITILEGTVYLRPGPRVARIVLAFARAIHPEIGW